MPVTFLLTPLVLGASGRIGRALRHRLGTDAALWQARRAQAGAGWCLFDPLSDPEALTAAAGAAGQILCLAGPVPGRGGGDLRDTIALGEAAVRAGAALGVRVLLASSAAIYGAQAGPLHEDLAPRPANAYGQAKAEMEARAQDLGRELGVAVCCLRIGNVAGFDAILGGWRPGFCLDQFADGRTPRRSYIGALTLADVLGALLALPELPPMLNIAQPGPVEMGALLRAAGREYVTAPAPDSAIAEVALDVARLTSFVAPKLALPAADPAVMWAEFAELEPHMKDEASP
ncbi:NAD(P)-dependent oxidoreductase [Phaeobacter sp. HF9A]|uniref:NAD-dependent epimerase/dehydratase family protein n=1 Tax=Phaeobacter sp. HF9A TaxID=2721561 RepID=UPI0014310324|nr:NAD(P)-dependent oxidoreductase [Phaeobacter sp. HF9A]NIZ15718.1 NAD(P)-dependent oxidoreductase [Phaeobacter sp. HF9A]